MSKLARKALIHYVDAGFGSTTSWFKVGQDLEELSVELNPDVEVIQNIWNETSVKDNKYEPQIEIDPYYANPSDNIYPKLKEIAMERLLGDDCKTTYLEVIVDTASGPYEAYKEDCLVKPTSYGGGTDGVAIPFTIYPDGNRVKGTVTFSNGVPTFTEEE